MSLDASSASSGRQEEIASASSQRVKPIPENKSNTVVYKLDLNHPPALPADFTARIDALTDWQIEQGIAQDPDANEPTTAEWATAYRVPDTKRIRKQLKMSQQQFAVAFGIPLGTLRDWEQKRRLPDAAAIAYLRVIRHNPQSVIDALALDH